MSSSFFNAGRQGTPTTTPTTSGTRVASGSQSGTPTTMDSRAGASTATFFSSETTSTGVVDVHLQSANLTGNTLNLVLTNGTVVSQALSSLGSVVSFNASTQTLTIDGANFVLSGTGDVTLAQLNAEIAARTSGDNGLDTRITALENAPSNPDTPTSQTDLQRFLENIKEIATSQDLVFDGNFPSTITYTLPDSMGTILATFVFNGNFPSTITYTGAMIDTILGNPDSEFIRTFTFAGNFPTNITWTEATIAALMLMFDGGRITRTAGTDAEWLQDGGRITENSDLVSQDGGRFTYTGA